MAKSKRVRTIFTPEQLKRLEQEFSSQMYLVGHYRSFLASSLNLTEAQVKVWFQNRRIKFRKLSPCASPTAGHTNANRREDNIIAANTTISNNTSTNHIINTTTAAATTAAAAAMINVDQSNHHHHNNNNDNPTIAHIGPTSNNLAASLVSKLANSASATQTTNSNAISTMATQVAPRPAYQF